MPRARKRRESGALSRNEPHQAHCWTDRWIADGATLERAESGKLIGSAAFSAGSGESLWCSGLDAGRKGERKNSAAEGGAGKAGPDACGVMRASAGLFGMHDKEIAARMKPPGVRRLRH